MSTRERPEIVPFNFIFGSLCFILILTVIFIVTCGEDNPVKPDQQITMMDIDGNIYKTVKIGNQVWMAENLKVTHYRDGGPIEYIEDVYSWVGLASGAYCNYNNDISNVPSNGRLYNWYTFAHRCIAPPGWHVPTNEDWEQLENYLGESNLGYKLKESGTGHWSSPNTGATNSSGFTALPGGSRSNLPINGTGYSDLGTKAYYYTQNVNYNNNQEARCLYDNDSSFHRNRHNNARRGCSVRLIKDVNPTVTDIDGNVYRTVRMGQHVWMIDNLKTTRYRNGDPIPNVTDDGAWYGLSTGAYCNYNNEESNGNKYGRLYNWYAVNDSRRIAPEGWHPASEMEWQTLIDYVGGEDTAAYFLKDSLYWYYPNHGGWNIYSISLLPTGYRMSLGDFQNVAHSSRIWSTTNTGTSAWAYRLDNDRGYIRSFTNGHRAGFAVRCVKDED